MLHLFSNPLFRSKKIDQLPYRFDAEFAQQLDEEDELKDYRNRFHIPQVNGSDAIYFTGNSLGCMPRAARAYVEQEFTDWEHLGVEGHFHGKRPWFSYHHFLKEKAARVVGALPSEVVMMNTLTTNLHLMMVSFYQPTAQRYKIIMEGGAFPSDQYAMESQARFHGLDPDKAIIELLPRTGEQTLRTEDILAKISEHGNELALVMMGGVNYYTGQAYDIEKIASAAHDAGAYCGFDLAHAAGNLVLKLHDWKVDFAVWCTYKYLNSGPGGLSGIFVHEKHGNDNTLPRFAGWWGYDEENRFSMKKGFIPMQGADGWQLSNAQIFPSAIHLASLDIYDEAGMENLSMKSLLLTGYLEYLVKSLNEKYGNPIQVITPADPAQRGCQLSLVVKNGKKVFEYLTEKGVIADWREPDVIRVAPVPLYNTFTDVYRFAKIIGEYFES